MAKKIEQWVDNDGDNHENELSALQSDLSIALSKSDTDEFDYLPSLTHEVKAAIDALHEYAHRSEPISPTKSTERIAVGRQYRCQGVVGVHAEIVARRVCGVSGAVTYVDRDGDVFDRDGKHLGGTLPTSSASPDSDLDLVLT